MPAEVVRAPEPERAGVPDPDVGARRQRNPAPDRGAPEDSELEAAGVLGSGGSGCRERDQDKHQSLHLVVPSS